MHSKIFQMATSPIKQDLYLTQTSIEVYCSEFADYIGDAVEGAERLDLIKSVATDFPELFEYVGDGILRFKGMGSFLEDWAMEIRSISALLTAKNILDIVPMYDLRSVATRTHKRKYSRFYIGEWNGFPGPASDLIEWLRKLKEGDLIYIGAVIDYHF